MFLGQLFLQTLGLTKISPFLSTFYGAFVAFLFIQRVLAPFFIPKWLHAAIEVKGRTAKNNWSVILPEMPIF